MGTTDRRFATPVNSARITVVPATLDGQHQRESALAAHSVATWTSAQSRLDGIISRLLVVFAQGFGQALLSLCDK